MKYIFSRAHFEAMKDWLIKNQYLVSFEDWGDNVLVTLNQ